MLLDNATLVLQDETVRGSLLVEKGVIRAIDTGTALPRSAISCEGDLVMPG